MARILSTTSTRITQPAGENHIVMLICTYASGVPSFPSAARQRVFLFRKPFRFIAATKVRVPNTSTGSLESAATTDVDRILVRGSWSACFEVSGNHAQIGSSFPRGKSNIWKRHFNTCSWALTLVRWTTWVQVIALE